MELHPSLEQLYSQPDRKLGAVTLRAHSGKRVCFFYALPEEIVGHYAKNPTSRTNWHELDADQGVNLFADFEIHGNWEPEELRCKVERLARTIHEIMSLAYRVLTGAESTSIVIYSASGPEKISFHAIVVGPLYLMSVDFLGPAIAAGIMLYEDTHPGTIENDLVYDSSDGSRKGAFDFQCTKSLRLPGSYRKDLQTGQLLLYMQNGELVESDRWDITKMPEAQMTELLALSLVFRTVPTQSTDDICFDMPLEIGERAREFKSLMSQKYAIVVKYSGEGDTGTGEMARAVRRCGGIAPTVRPNSGGNTSAQRQGIDEADMQTMQTYANLVLEHYTKTNPEFQNGASMGAVRLSGFKQTVSADEFRSRQKGGYTFTVQTNSGWCPRRGPTGGCHSSRKVGISIEVASHFVKYRLLCASHNHRPHSGGDCRWNALSKDQFCRTVRPRAENIYDGAYSFEDK